MKKILILCCLITMSVSAARYEVSSPNGKVKVMVTAEETVTWSVTYDGKTTSQAITVSAEPEPTPSGGDNTVLYIVIAIIVIIVIIAVVFFFLKKKGI